MNLLEETIEDIRNSGHNPGEIVFIGSRDGEYSCTWDEFQCLADREYYDGYGIREVARDLVIVFSDGKMMWREECDGCEWWSYGIPFTVPEKSKPIKSIFGCGDIEYLDWAWRKSHGCRILRQGNSGSC